MSRAQGFWSATVVAVICSCGATGAFAADESAASSSAGSELQEVTVTGSRVIANGDDSPTPVTVLSAQTLEETTPGPVSEALMRLPEFGIGHNPTTNPANSGQNTSALVLNLRNMGTTRDLILFDGLRVTPTSTVYEVDTSFVPQMLLERVDIVTGGASAVYGSDAVTGVVNFITDHNFNGFKIDAHTGISEYRDGQENQLGLAGGISLFGGRGHIEGSAEFFDTPGIIGCGGRGFCQDAWTIQGAGSAANPYVVVENTRLSSTSFNGLIPNYQASANPGNPLRGSEFTTGGVLIPFPNGTATNQAGVQSGGGGGWYNQSSEQALLASNLAFVRFDFDVTNTTHLSAEVTGEEARNWDQTQYNEVRNITLSSTNAFLASQYQASMASAGIKTFTFSKMFTDMPVLDSATWTRHVMAAIVLDGKVGNYKWEVFYHPDYSSQNTRNDNDPNNQNLAAAEDAVINPATGQTVCNVTLTNPGLYPGCVPLNMFGPNSESQEAINYILQQTQFTAVYRVHNFGASISGAPLSTWAGPVDTALSADWRHLSYYVDSDAQPVAANCTGLRFNCSASTLQFAGNVLASLPAVSQTVTEAALETNVPLLKDVPFAQSLALNGAVRYTYYSTSGSATTYKLGLEWHLNDQLTIRGTRSRDIRAPSVIDLYAPPLFTVGGSNVDLHTGNSVVVPLITYSNTNLKPEVAQDETAGIVYKPQWLPRFSVALDYFSIVIDNAIIGVSGNSANIENTCNASNGTSPLCALIPRPLPFSNTTAQNNATAFLTEPENVLQQITYGGDLEVNYQMPLLGGELSFRNLTTYQPHLTTQLPGQAATDAAGAGTGACCQLFGVPKVQSSALGSYANGPYTVSVEERYQGVMVWNADRTQVYNEPNLPHRYYTDLALGYQWGPSQLYFSARNLTNTQPLVYSRSGFSGAPGVGSGYVNGEDTIGTYYTLGFRMKL